MKALTRAIILICFFGVQLKATNYYVNDASLIGDIYTAAVGSNSNPGTAALPFATLTYALTLAAPNDIIYIDAGSYNDKNLTVTTANLSIIGAGPSVTVFNNNYASANSNLFLTIQTNGVVVKNLMVIKYNYGLGSSGKAITINNALNVLLYNLVLTDNADNGDAALLILSNSTVTIKKGSYSCNLSGGAYGGGIDIGDANTTVSNVTVLIDSAAISYNSKTQVQGGGLDVYGTASVFVTVTNCTVSDNLSNTLSIGGAGIYQQGGTVTVRKTCFTNNNSDDASQTNYGGAYFVTAGTTKIANCTFTNNKSGRGGAIAAYSLNGPISLVVDSSSFTGNTYSSTTINPTARDLFARVAFSSAVTVTGTENTFSPLANAVANYNTASVTLSNSGNPSKMGAVTLTNTTPATWTPNPVCPAIIGACVCTTPAITSAAPAALICSGSTFSTSLTANTANVYTSYSWSSSVVAGITGHSTSGTGNISETLTNSTGGALTVTYTITPNFNGLCSGSAVVYSVSVVPKPTLTISGTTSICAGQSTVLSGATANSYSWNTGITTNTISVSPPVGTTNYTLTGDNGGGCVSTKTVAVTVAANPTVNITGTNAICSGQNTVLTAATASNYTWSTTANTSTISVSPTSNTTYTLTGVTGACTATAAITVSVTATPTVNITGTAAICSGQSTVLTAATATNYTWSTTANTSTVSVSPTSNTTYTLTGANGACTATTSITVSVTATPTVNITGTNAICSGQSTVLTAATANNYTWSTTANTNTINVNPTTNTTYTLTGANGGCTATAAITVSVTTTPTINITGTNAICSGQSTMLTAATASNYTWSTTANTSTISVNPTTNTTYTLIGANGACTATAAITVSVTATPTVNITGSNAICSGESTVLTVATAGNYTWSTTENTSTISVNPTTNTIYTLTGSNGACTSTAAITVSVTTTPTVNISGTNVICSGQSTVLTAATAGNYTWSTTENTSTIIVSPTSNTIYTLTGANGACTATAAITVSVTATPTVNISGTNTICSGQSTVLTAATAGNYTWSTTATTNTISVNPTTNTTYTITGANGVCTATAAITVSVTTTPTVNITGTNVICSGQSTVLTGATANSYSWSTGGITTNTISVSPTTSTSYTLIGTNGTCTASATATVTINPLPIIGTSTITAAPCGLSTGCIDSVAVGSGTPTYQYSWDGGTTWSNASQHCNVPAGPYTVTVKDVNGCTASANISVPNASGPSAPTLSVSASSVCEGSTVMMDITPIVGTYTYTWTDAAGTHTGTTYTITNISPAGNYSVVVTATDGSGCISAATNTVIAVTALPNVTAVATTTTICSGQNSTLSASGGTTYTWSANASNATINTVVVNPTSNTTYTVTGANGACLATQTISVNVNPAPTVILNSTGNICTGQTATLTASGATNYTWLPSNATTTVITDSPGTNITYTVIGESLGCTSTQTVAINITATPSVSATASQTTICSNQTTTLTASGATNYTWLPGGTGTSISVNPTTTTTYTLTGDTVGCSSAPFTISINVNTSPTVSITPSATAICSGQTATLTASGATNYTWFPSNTTGTVITDNPTTNSTYTLIGDVAGCGSTPQVFTINVNLTPTLSIISNQAVCAGGTVNGVTYSSGSTVNWLNTNANIGIGLSGTGNINPYTAPSNTITQTGVITATPTDPVTTCVGNPQTFTITIYPNPTVSGGNTDTAKCGLLNGGVTGINVSGGTNPIHYQWYDSTAIMANDTLSTLGNVGTGTYSILITDANGCIAIGSATSFTVASIAAPTIVITPQLSQGTAPLDVTFSSASTNVTSYNWNFGNGTSSLLQNPVQVTYTTPGTYTVLLSASNSACTTQDTAIVIVDSPVSIVIPNIYSPNGDGINDEWFITCTGIKTLHCDIFNRWGTLIYQILAPNDSWNGIMNNGNSATDGTYFYILDATGLDGKQYKSNGSLTLVK